MGYMLREELNTWTLQKISSYKSELNGELGLGNKSKNVDDTLFYCMFNRWKV